MMNSGMFVCGDVVEGDLMGRIRVCLCCSVWLGGGFNVALGILGVGVGFWLEGVWGMLVCLLSGWLIFVGMLFVGCWL